MWKKHPLTRFLFGTSLALIFSLGLLLAAVIGADYWAEGKAPPLEISGKIINKSPKAQMPNGSGSFDLETTDPPLIYSHLEVEPRIFRQLSNEQEVVVAISPSSHHVYSIKTASSREIIKRNEWDEGEIYQDYQAAVYWSLVGVGVTTALAFIYGMLGLADWLLKAQVVRGVIVSRIEQADFSAAGYGMLLRRAPLRGNRKSLRFQLNEMDFLATDGADYAQVKFTPIFRYVRQVQTLTAADFLTNEVPSLEGGDGQTVRLRYLTPWRRKLLVFSDGIVAFCLFSLVIFFLANSVPSWLAYGVVGAVASLSTERYIFPALAIFCVGLGLLFGANFLRKLRDLRAPKKLTVGPVLSKWRVNGGTNDTRRQIVVADGGLQAGSESIRKFDISNFLFEELRVGDIVEIEHTPRLRYIFRLEVKGHQELVG